MRILTRRDQPRYRPMSGDCYSCGYWRGLGFDRMHDMMKRWIRLIVILATGIAPSLLQAHGSVTPEDDICIIQIGYYKAHFKMYLPQSKGHKEYCEDIPGTGETIFVMEYEHSGLGAVPVDFRIVRNVTGNGVFTNLEDILKINDLDAITVVHHEAAVQPDVFTIRYDFQEQGEFVGVVNVRNPDTGKLYTAVFPFEVGFAGVGWWVWFVLIAIALQANYFLMSGRFKRIRTTRRQPMPVVNVGDGRA